MRWWQAFAAALCVLLPCSLGRAAPEGADRLQSGLPVRFAIGPKVTSWVGQIAVPADAERLLVAASAGREVRLEIRPAGSETWIVPSSNPAASSDPIAVLDGSSRPRIEAGVWAIRVSTVPGTESRFEGDVVAFVDLPGGPRTLLPRMPTTSTALGEARPSALFRSFLPPRARRLSFRIASETAGLRFSLLGPQAYARKGAFLRKVVLDRSEVAGGVYTLEVTGSFGKGDQTRIYVSAEWTFGGEGAGESETIQLEAGRPVTVELGGADRPAWVAFRFEVPTGTSSFLLSANEDVDLLLRRDQPIREGMEDAEWFGLRSTFPEELAVGGTEDLTPGTYHGRVVLFDPTEAAEVPLSLEFRGPASRVPVWGSADPPVLPFDTWMGGTVRPGEAAVTWHTLVVPAGAASVHACIQEATEPIDLVLASPADGATFARSLTSRVDERIDHVFPAPLADAKRLLLGVVSREGLEDQVTYRVAASKDRRPVVPPPGSDWPPLLRGASLSALEKVGAATVEITTRGRGGGTGSCVSPRGLVLTCRHVLMDEPQEGEDWPEAVQSDEILIAFPPSLDVPPVQSFVARLVREDEGLDLALLRIDRDVYDRPIPADLRLPWMPLGDSRSVTVGDPVTVLGYPECGSCRTRTALVVSRGIVAGWERSRQVTRWMKTDAWISSGYSGGALVDRDWRLVGIPAATLGETESLGLVVPTEVLPAEWKVLIGKDFGGK